MRPTEFVCSYFSSILSLVFSAQREAHCSHNVRWSCLQLLQPSSSSCASLVSTLPVRNPWGTSFDVVHGPFRKLKRVCVNKRHTQLSYWILRGRVRAVFRIPA